MKNFDSFRISGCFVDYSRAEVVILPISYERTVTWKKGTSKGPEAIIEAFLNMELYDDELDINTHEVGLCLFDRINLNNKEPEEAISEIEKIMGDIIRDDKFPIILGGEHSVSIGAVKALKDRYVELSVLQLDAHADLREEYYGSMYNHACVMSRIREFTDAVQVGIRSLSNDEMRIIRDGNYEDKIFWARDIYNNRKWFESAINKLSGDVYITIDLDVFDPSIMPATGTPEPGGMDWYLIMEFLREVCGKRNIVGFDIVELSPLNEYYASNFLAAKLMYKLVGYVFLKSLRNAK